MRLIYPDVGILPNWMELHVCRARNYWVSGCPGHPKKVTETQFLEQVFRPETQELSGNLTTANLGLLTGNPEIVEEIQILRQVFRTETQISVVISSPAVCIIQLKPIQVTVLLKQWIYGLTVTPCT